MMQETRRYILDILRERGQATVDEIVEALQRRRGKEITAVTVRHHLARLQQEALITEPELRHRTTPGRPQHLYTLTEKARDVFPNNYQQLVTQLLTQLHQQLSSPQVNVILEGVADNLAAQICIPDVPQEERLNIIVSYLNQQGYDAYWETNEQGYILHTRNCPYHDVAHKSETLCSMDLRLISTLTGIVPRRLTRVSAGDQTCAYLIPYIDP
jgi:predicted ArsR family transcriptional regulator